MGLAIYHTRLRLDRPEQAATIREEQMRSASRPTFSRRQVLHALGAAGVGIVTGGAGYGYLYERTRIEVTRSSVPVSGLPEPLHGLRVGLLTDLHASSTVPAAHIQRAASLLLAERPDLVALGGDYISWFDTRYATPCADALASLTAPHGVYAVLGNHDDDTEVPAALAAQGFTVLKDARTRVTIRGERLDIAGLRFWTRRTTEVAGVLRGATTPVLLLAHDPRRLVDASALDVSVVLSGHTHGGQVVLPGLGALAARGHGYPGVAGLVRRENTTLFVSRGVGTVYVPVRLNCPPEVAILTLQRQSEI
jgi:hypothetical protein